MNSDSWFRGTSAIIRSFVLGIYTVSSYRDASVKARMDDADELIAIALLLTLDKRKRHYLVHPLNIQRLKKSQYYLKRAKLRAHP